MRDNVSIDSQMVTRVEGHGTIEVKVKDGKLETARFNIVEAPRYFEAMVRGRHFMDIHYITSRICGICSIGHVMASVQATENALGLEISELDVKLRKLLLHGETLQSHALHVFFLAAPDFLGVKSVIPLVESHPEVVNIALRVKGHANDMCDVVGGRTTHPVTVVPGGFTAYPTVAELLEIKRSILEDAVPDALKAIDVLETLVPVVPAFERETEYISLYSPDEYAFYTGQLKSSDGVMEPKENYRAWTNEHEVPHSSAKHCKHTRSSFMASALARFNNCKDLLVEPAKEVAVRLGLHMDRPDFNPFLNTMAQTVEMVHAYLDSVRLIDEIVAMGIPENHVYTPPQVTKGGQGVGAVEVPRGILYHDYVYDDTGHVIKANCIIPTGQNLANIDEDIQAFVPSLLEKTDDEIVHNIEMLIRAYDPCISCSVHYVDLSKDE